MNRYRLSLMLLILLSACTDRQAGDGSVLPQDCRLRVGDVVLRCGSGLLSHAVLMAEGSRGVYSHVGIVVDSAGVQMIVHAVPDEPDFEGDIDRVKMEAPEAFFRRTKAQRGAVLRHRDSLVAQRAAIQALKAYQRRVLFDHEYNDADTTRMYCTELIVYAFDRAGAALQGVEHQRLPLPGLDYECVMPSDIFECRDFYLINRF
ncbi:MAG: hypothetical protein IKZ48_08925 [Prevotella sp.]|nr:hypothetical protein [Prevotella sp.]